MLRTLFLLPLLALAATAAGAHEFWLLPDRFHFAAGGGSTALTLSVGEQFHGERVGFARPLLARFLHASARGRVDLVPRADDAPAAAFRLSLRDPGTHVVALTTQPSEIVLPADQFHAYLRDEGLEAVIRQREAAGQAGAPGRERYRRTIKTLLQVGAAHDRSYATRIGQTLELIPLADPSKRRAGADLPFLLLFEGRPLEGALVKFWRRAAQPALVQRSVTDRAGKMRLAAPQAGVWMASVVHMVPATETPRHDWDSYWGNLTFEVREDPGPAGPRCCLP